MTSKIACNVSEMWNLEMPQGLDLEITHHPLRMKDVVNLIIAIERLTVKTSKQLKSTEFSDENLLNIMMESIVEEQIVQENEAAAVQFHYVNEHQCSVTDHHQRSLVLVKNSMELHAVMLQGGSDNRKVYLNMSAYVHPTPSAEGRPVALAIKGTKLYLSCHKDGDVPTLHLETVEDKDDLSQISPDSDNVRFLFYKLDSGLNISTLMSARYPEWYISTEESDNKPVEMCQVNAQRYRTFNIENLS
uniref:Interleukin-1 n=1 Tax=Channa punctata TaxID=304456 RepID=A0A514C9B1_CHAPF|nr:interleukin-1 beta [Channa punctata]